MKALILAGATASGKSSRALEIAKAQNGVIINCDSRQLYKDVPILAACPLESEKKEIPHYLYEILDGTEKYDAMAYARAVAQILPEMESMGKTPIFVGGTGLYINALMKGLSPIPNVNACVVEALNAKAKERPVQDLHEELSRKDPELATRLSPTDTQHILRGLAVFDSTKRPLSYFQSLPKQKVIDLDVEFELIERPVKELWERIEQRVTWMFENGAIEEVKKLKAKNYPETAPVLESIGVSEILDLLDEKMTMDEAKELITIRTRQYAKRQRTWFRGQL
ncbi:MAG: tRNA (adenosine(37)-N6)-dimethylallyltransferase MiaA [Alphaproteobacteria bacterium]|nr:tRNA (adenosine(37)-N6)-dimethylallyltransferase MiaA [Alphaproteobacteria bacterium]MBN2779924.1 tRNA (adenosine(37)-N6)-dimethylallyltransferase MiaA [Alphaproteobacteria bacterium]